MSRKKWSKLVKARDNYTCVKCGMTDKQAALEAHHIVKRIGKSELSDGVTLCKWCHLAADMGKRGFSNWMKSSGFYDEFILFLKNNHNDIYSKFSNIDIESIRLFLGALSLFEKQLNIKRSLIGKMACKYIKSSNRKSKCQK